MQKMITSRFCLSQDEKSLTIKVRAPYCNLRDLEVDVDDNVFLFFCKPYYLRLNLPGNIVENENTKSSYDSNSGEFTFCYEKVNPHEDFKDLELITKFLVTKVDASYRNGEKITVLASEGSVEEKFAQADALPSGFGFAMQSNKHFVTVSSEFYDVFEVNPSEINLPERRKLRLQNEQDKFDMGHYRRDYIEDYEIAGIIWECPWDELHRFSLTFNSKELDFLKDLPNVDYNLNDLQIKYVFNTLVDIMYAYCYVRRVNFYKENSESGWTIVKLSASLCWLDAFENVKETLICAFRRSVTYPLYRNFNLSLKIFNDLKEVLLLGEKCIITCLIDIYYIFLGGDCCRYILNSLFIKDYITYIMKWDKTKWQEFLGEVCKVEIKKEDLGLNLLEIEHGFTLEKRMSKLQVKESDSDDTSADSDDTSDISCSETSDADSDTNSDS